MDGVLNSSINTNTTFSRAKKLEAYGREEGMRPSLMARLSGLLMKILILLLFLSTPDPRQSLRYQCRKTCIMILKSWFVTSPVRSQKAV
jgi:hypothetical protein